MEIEKFLLIFGPLLCLLAAYFWADNQIKHRWINYINMQQKINNTLTSCLRNTLANPISCEETLKHLVAFIYYNDFIQGKEIRYKTRPFYVGLWAWVIGPVTLFYFPFSLIILLIKSQFAIYIALISSLLALYFLIIANYFNKEERTVGPPLTPAQCIHLIKNIKCTPEEKNIIRKKI